MAPSKRKQLKAKKAQQFETSNFRLGKYKSNPRTKKFGDGASRPNKFPTQYVPLMGARSPHCGMLKAIKLNRNR